MRATVGDRIIVHSRHVDEPERVGEVVEIHGPDGTPPYLVRWDHDHAPTLLVPGPDTHVEHVESA